MTGSPVCSDLSGGRAACVDRAGRRKFADLVRRPTPLIPPPLMAIAGMEQFGWYIASHGIPAAPAIALPAGVTVLLPYCALRATDPLPHSWDVTSDTIAARVAADLSLDLLLLKSVDGIHHRRRLLSRVEDPSLTCDEVDPLFIPFVFEHGIRARVINGRYDDRVREPSGKRWSPGRSSIRDFN